MSLPKDKMPFYWVAGSASAGIAIAAVFLGFMKSYVYSVEAAQGLEGRVARLEVKQNEDRKEILYKLEKIEEKIDRIIDRR